MADERLLARVKDTSLLAPARLAITQIAKGVDMVIDLSSFGAVINGAHSIRASRLIDELGLGEFVLEAFSPETWARFDVPEWHNGQFVES